MGFIFAIFYFAYLSIFHLTDFAYLAILMAISLLKLPLRQIGNHDDQY
ncbi:hypothetical protein CEV31_2262 [Brucella thiophenivorans]|uniref:Uncharacterized protein n=1 Tax=Brucella thiophenivorans TaxID=571255 RepID=A0A256FVM6_9HYPH|nr:hypothetical protein CEV31_2262 [Brucella thiophenivorans]